MRSKLDGRSLRAPCNLKFLLLEVFVVVDFIGTVGGFFILMVSTSSSARLKVEMYRYWCVFSVIISIITKA